MRLVRTASLRIALALLALACSSWIAEAQTAQVVRNVNLRTDPSSANDPIRLLKPPEEVTLVSTVRQNSYYHVRTATAEDGWVWSANVEVITTPPVPPTPTTPAGVVIVLAVTGCAARCRPTPELSAS